MGSLSLMRGLTAIEYNVDNIIKKPGEDIFLSIITNDDSKINAFGFDLKFPAQKTKFVGIEKAGYPDRYFEIGFNEISPGFLRVGGYRIAKKQEASSGIFIILVFRVKKPPLSDRDFNIVATYDDIIIETKKTKIILKKPAESDQNRPNKGKCMIRKQY